MVSIMREYPYIDAAKEDKVMSGMFEHKWKPVRQDADARIGTLVRRGVYLLGYTDPAKYLWLGEFEHLTREDRFNFSHPLWRNNLRIGVIDMPGYHPRKKIISPLEVYSDPVVQNSIPPAKTYTEAEVNRLVDFAYLTGVFNTSGIDGLHAELSRLKGLGKEPHQFINRNQH